MLPMKFTSLESRDDELGADRRHDWRGRAEKFVTAGTAFRETWKSSPTIGPEECLSAIFLERCGVMEEEQLPRVSVHEVFGIIAVVVERKERTEVTRISVCAAWDAST